VTGRLEKAVIDGPDPHQAGQEPPALGAVPVPGERETGFRVCTNPAGHPICIVFGQRGAD
jgi:hypothetical protein